MSDNLVWITPGVGSALSGLMTALGAIIGVWLAQRYFGSKVKDLKSALAETESAIELFRTSALQKFGELDASLAGLQESLSRTEAAVYEGQETSEEANPEAPDNPSSARDIVKGYWSEITTHLEEIASSPAVDGRTRAKYGRIDRRSYYDLIAALDADRRLAGATQSANRAAELWYSCRRANAIGGEAVDEMKRLKDIILAVPAP